jgi:hypothetical protein
MFFVVGFLSRWAKRTLIQWMARVVSFHAILGGLASGANHRAGT